MMGEEKMRLISMGKMYIFEMPVRFVVWIVITIEVKFVDWFVPDRILLFFMNTLDKRVPPKAIDNVIDEVDRYIPNKALSSLISAADE